MMISSEPTNNRSRIGRIVAILVLGAGAWWWIESTRPEPAPSAMERAGGPARPATTPIEADAGPGASPLSSDPNAALVVPSSPVPVPEKLEPEIVTIGREGGVPTTDDPARQPVYRSALENSPGYVRPVDPESMSVITGRREAPAVTGELVGGAPSLAALVGVALDAVGRSDESALHRLRVTRGEFERYLWREFPQSRPITNIQAEDAWGMISPNSTVGASSVVAELGGKRLEAVRIESSGRMEYRNFTMWRDVVIVARDATTGEEHRLTFLPAVVERHGRHKVFAYQD
jgi:hypothetical protein